MYILYSMPPKLYNKYTGGKYESYDEMIKMRKQRDNHKNKIRYYREKYNYDLVLEDYEEFNKYVNLIKNIYDIHHFFINYNDDDEIKKDDLNMYINKHKFIKDALHIQDYVKTLKKINQESDDEFKDKKYILEF